MHNGSEHPQCSSLPISFSFVVVSGAALACNRPWWGLWPMSSWAAAILWPMGNVSYICSTQMLPAPFPLFTDVGPALVVLTSALLSLKYIHCQTGKGNCLIVSCLLSNWEFNLILQENLSHYFAFCAMQEPGWAQVSSQPTTFHGSSVYMLGTWPGVGEVLGWSNDCCSGWLCKLTCNSLKTVFKQSVFKDDGWS